MGVQQDDRPRPGRRRAVAAGGAVAIHAALLGLLALGLETSRDLAVHDDPPMTPVFLVPAPREVTPSPRDRPVRTASPAPSPGVSASKPEVSVPAAPAGELEPSTADIQAVRRALRGGAVGCANPSLLSQAEREACDLRLASGAMAEAYIQAPIAPEMRGYYDAVAKAKAGGFAEDHGPGFGCRILFGQGKAKVSKPPNSLKLGPLPCFITPPKTPYTITADIAHPDTQ